MPARTWLDGRCTGSPAGCLKTRARSNFTSHPRLIAALAIAALAAFAVWEEWLNLVVGLWALVSPWVLGFQGTTAMTVHVIIGAAVAILAAVELWMMSQIPPRLTTGR